MIPYWNLKDGKDRIVVHKEGLHTKTKDNPSDYRRVGGRGGTTICQINWKRRKENRTESRALSLGGKKGQGDPRVVAGKGRETIPGAWAPKGSAGGLACKGNIIERETGRNPNRPIRNKEGRGSKKKRHSLETVA